MLNLQFLKQEQPIAWTQRFMPQEKKQKSVELIDHGAGDGTAIYRVGRKLFQVTFGEDFFNENMFVTVIDGAQIETLKKERGYFIPDTFVIDPETGLYKEISRADERLLIEQLSKNENFSMENRLRAGKEPKPYRTLGKYFSTKDGVVYANPKTPPYIIENRADQSVRPIENGVGKGEAIYSVGQKKIYITFGAFPYSPMHFATTIEEGYVDTAVKTSGRFTTITYEMDEKTGLKKEVSREDEKLLIEQLARNEKLTIAQRYKQQEATILYETIGKYFSTMGGNVFDRPSYPIKRPPPKRDKRLVH